MFSKNPSMAGGSASSDTKITKKGKFTLCCVTASIYVGTGNSFSGGEGRWSPEAAVVAGPLS